MFEVAGITGHERCHFDQIDDAMNKIGMRGTSVHYVMSQPLACSALR